MKDNKNNEIEENESNYDSSKYQTPDGVPSDVAIFTITSSIKNPGAELPKRTLEVLMVKRKKWPFKGCWALPGGFSNPNETPLMAAERELQEETQIDGLHIKQLDVYGKPKRDPRGWIISSAYYALVNESYLAKRKAADDAADVKLVPLHEVFSMKQGSENGTFENNEGTLAFDHKEIIKDAFMEIQNEIIRTDIAKEFLDKEFTLAELKQIIQTVVTDFNEPEANFKRKLLQRKIIEEVVGKKSNKYSRREAQLYKFTGKIPKLSIYN